MKWQVETLELKKACWLMSRPSYSKRKMKAMTQQINQSVLTKCTMQRSWTS